MHRSQATQEDLYHYRMFNTFRGLEKWIKSHLVKGRKTAELAILTESMYQLRYDAAPDNFEIAIKREDVLNNIIGWMTIKTGFLGRNSCRVTIKHF